jgi:hypothetical protein
MSVLRILTLSWGFCLTRPAAGLAHLVADPGPGGTCGFPEECFAYASDCGGLSVLLYDVTNLLRRILIRG